MTMIPRQNKTIQNLEYKSAVINKNFEPKICKRFKGISKAIFKYAVKKLSITERNIDATKREEIDTVVRWGQKLAATRKSGTMKHWPATSMNIVHNNEPNEEDQPATGLRTKSKASLNGRYIRSV